MDLFAQVHRGDGPAACFPAVLILVGIIVVLLIVLGQRSAVRQTLQRVATHLGGRLQPGNLFHDYDRIQFEHDGQGAELRFSRTGKHRRYTHLEIPWSGPPLRCEVYPEGFLASLQKLMGMEDIVIGSPQFDWQFIITGDDARGIKSLLNAKVQSVIFNLAGQYPGIHVRFAPRSLTVTCSSQLSDFVRLIEFTKQGRELYDAALALQAQGIEFLDQGKMTLGAATAGAAHCMVCGEVLETEIVYCQSCRTPHHRDCWAYSGGCSTYGCRETTFVRS